MKQFFIVLAVCLTANSGKTQVVMPAILNSSTTKGNIGNISFELSLGEMATSTIGNNTIVTQGFLQPLVVSSNSPLPVLGLDFRVKRVSNKQVQLDWKTLQEINNQGFFIERKKETENSFVSLRFMPSQATGGNSSMPLTYAALDTNIFAGNTYYRLQQKDLNGQSTYSMVRTVNGDAAKTITLKAWPVPAKEFYVQVDGIDKEIVQVVDVSGRVVRNYTVANHQPVMVNGLPQGTYFLRLQHAVDVVQKVVVQ